MSKYIEGTRKLGRVTEGADPAIVGRRRSLPGGAIQLEKPKTTKTREKPAIASNREVGEKSS